MDTIIMNASRSRTDTLGEGGTLRHLGRPTSKLRCQPTPRQLRSSRFKLLDLIIFLVPTVR